MYWTRQRWTNDWGLAGERTLIAGPVRRGRRSGIVAGIWIDWTELAVRHHRIEQGWALLPLLDWRRAGEDQQVDSLPLPLREQLATTAQKVSTTFELGARVREQMAARREPGDRDYYRSRAAWNQAVARFERAQADALRAGRLLATPWRPVLDADHPNQLPTSSAE